MNKILVIFSSIVLLSMLSTNVVAWDDCPFGYEDESYPGTCWRYVDTNGDGICDHSQEDPVEEDVDDPAEQGVQTQKDSTSEKNYLVMIFLSFFLVLIGSLLGKALVRKKKLSRTKEKLFWNIMLLIVFIPSAVTGVILLGLKDLSFLIGYGNIFTQLHNISSLFFMWISAYHIIWHTSYYMKCLKKS